MGTIRICIGNYAAYNEGYLVDRWVDLPMKQDELEKTVGEIQKRAQEIAHSPADEFYVADYDGCPFGLSGGGLFDEHADIDHLNVLAHVMQANPGGCEMVERILEMGADMPQDLLELCNWIVDADEIPWYPYELPPGTDTRLLEPSEKYALTCLYLNDQLEQLENMDLLDFIDLDALGNAWADGALFDDDGYFLTAQSMPKATLSWGELEEGFDLDVVEMRQ